MIKQRQPLAAGYTIVVASVMVALLSVASVGILNMTKYSEHLGDAAAHVFSDEVILKQAVRALSSTKLGKQKLHKCPDSWLSVDESDLSVDAIKVEYFWGWHDNCSNPFIKTSHKTCEVYYVNLLFIIQGGKRSRVLNCQTGHSKFKYR